ncbi:MAG: DUF7124 domain-containing protein [Halanaeroarchaeum sp.]
MTRNATGDRPLPDGGRRTPGVPDVSDDAADAQDRDDSETDGSASQSQTTTASGRQMPGVPQTEGASEDAPAENEGGSCGTDHDHDHEPEHDLTTAITVRALERTKTPGAVVADANTWSDWVGVVGERSGPALNTYFRNHSIDVDFFNDVSDGPAERLAAIDEGHHFYSERRVLVGLPEEREWAEAAGWEFQPFAETAEEAGWTLEDG